VTPTNLWLNQVADAAVADTVGINSPDVAVRLIREPFTPAPTLADTTAADFGGYGDKGADSPTWGFDPSTGERVLRATPPAGGWHWETTNTTNLPQTIYGYVWFNTDNDDVFASSLVPTPIVLTDANQVVDIPDPTLTINPAAFV